MINENTSRWYLPETANSFIRGFARVGDPLATLSRSRKVYRFRLNPEQDLESLRSDWFIVGREIASAMKMYEELIQETNINE